MAKEKENLIPVYVPGKGLMNLPRETAEKIITPVIEVIEKRKKKAEQEKAKLKKHKRYIRQKQ